MNNDNGKGVALWAWLTFAVLMLLSMKFFGHLIKGESFGGPVSMAAGLISFVVILLLLFGIEKVKGAPKEFGHYFLLGRATGISVPPGMYPTLGNIVSMTHFPGDQDLIEIPVTATCSSAAGSGKGADITVTFNLEAALDRNEVEHILSLGSVNSTDMNRFREELHRFAVSKIEEHAKNAMISMTLDELNSDRFRLIELMAKSMWVSGQAPQGKTLQSELRDGCPNFIRGLIVSALRIKGVSEPHEIKYQRTMTQVSLAQVETAQANLQVALVREKQYQMEAASLADIVAQLTAQGVPKEQIGLIAASLAQKMKVDGKLNVFSSDGSQGSAGVAQATALGQALSQGLGNSRSMSGSSND